MIEHENRHTPEEEFWKLLHLYAPLKVLVCYPPRPDEGLDSFDQVRDRVCDFHPRSADDAYLVIIGQHDAAPPADLDWQGHEIRAGQQRFTRIKVSHLQNSASLASERLS